MKHVIDSQQFTRIDLEKIFRIADGIKKRKGSPMKGKVMASLFYEPSTRTRFSFETAMKRLGGEVVSTENAREFSSAAKGETLEDSIRVMNEYVDVIVMRHYEMGAAARAAAVSRIPIINAGDGPGQHPTQALLDLYTIRRELGHIDNISIAMVGDLKNGRTIRSLSGVLCNYKNIQITFVSPEGLKIGDDIKEYLKKHGVKYDETEKLESIINTADVIYQTRIQKERFASEKEYLKYKGCYVINGAMADKMKKKSIIMHPLPRVDEILPEVDSSPKAAYFRQAGYGLLVRMALLVYIFKK